MTLINPNPSSLGLRGYCCHFRTEDRRGCLSVWLQPPPGLAAELFSGGMGLQVQHATLMPDSNPRGQHYHPHESAIDCFHLEEGEIVLALEDVGRSTRELFYFSTEIVLFFPPMVAHAVWNVGSSIVRFTALKTWNHGLVDWTLPHPFELGSSELEDAKQTVYQMPSCGYFGFGGMPTTQIDPARLSGDADGCSVADRSQR